MVEQRFRKAWVVGPNPTIGSMRHSSRRSWKRIALLIIAFFVFCYFFLFYGFGYLVNIAFSLREPKRTTQKSSAKPTSDVTIEPSLQDLPYATNSATITVSGNAMPDATVYIYNNNRRLDQTKTDFDGNFSFSVTLEEGKNSIEVTSKEESGRELSSRTYSVSYSNTPPKLDISNIEDGKTYRSPDLTISGTVEKEVYVTIQNTPVVVRSDGTFSQSIRLNEGDQTITIVATDVAGNETKKEYKVTYKKQD